MTGGSTESNGRPDGGDTVPSSSDSLGLIQIGRYRATRELGRGGMGIVYEAVDPALGRRVAIKVINLQSFTGSGETQTLRERLFREARSAGALSHPGIVIVYDVGEDHERAFIAMELVKGPSLQQVQQSTGTLAPREVVDILRQVASALDYAHKNGVVHRDIKPANIMLHLGSQVKIADFGIAKVATAPKYTVTGLVMGTPAYMSPEQIEGREIDGRSDQFSLAVVAYELLTGAVPFQGTTYASMVHTIVYGERPSARAANPLVPGSFDAVLARGMARRIEDRFASCTEFATALDSALQVAANREAPTEVITSPPSILKPVLVGAAITAQPAPQPRVQSLTQAMPKSMALQPATPPRRSNRRLLAALVALALVAVALAAALVYRFVLLGGGRGDHTNQQQVQQQPQQAPSNPGQTIAQQSTPAQSTVPPNQRGAANTASAKPEEPTAAAKAPPLAGTAAVETSEPKGNPVNRSPKRVAPEPPTTQTVSVRSNQRWNDTGIDLVKGDRATIRASGSVQVAANPKLHNQQPGGFYPNCDVPKRLFGEPKGDVLAPDLSCWELIGRVGLRGKVFEIGMRGEVPTGSVGRLFLGVNDDDYSDNAGAWSATVTVTHGPGSK